MEAVLRDAATIVLARNCWGGPGIEVYLIDRPKTMGHLPGYSVYPGGKLDEDDSSPFWEQAVASSDSLSVPLQLYIAAIRECFEEVGWLVGARQSGQIVTQDAEWDSIRTRLIKREITFSDWVNQQGFTFDLSSIRFFGIRQTPRVVSPTVRFLTYFFLVELPGDSLLRPDSYEVTEARWIRPQDALSLHAKGELKMVLPTLDSLRILSYYQTVKEAWLYAPGVGHPTPYELM